MEPTASVWQATRQNLSEVAAVLSVPNAVVDSSPSQLPQVIPNQLPVDNPLRCKLCRLDVCQKDEAAFSVSDGTS